MAISEKTKKMLWGRSAGRCAMSECRKILILDDSEGDDSSLIGEICHIAGDSDGGPRANTSLTQEERDAYPNLVLLCRNHHKQIDDQTTKFSEAQLLEIKSKHEAWVATELEGYDAAKQADDESYAAIVDGWLDCAQLFNWANWSSYLFCFGQPEMSVSMDQQLFELRRWLIKRVWPRRYADIEISFCNFNAVLNDFQEVFRKHAVKVHEDGLTTEKFYKIRGLSHEEYLRLSTLYEWHVDLVQDLMLELTRAANLICDTVRLRLRPTFWVDEGRLTVMGGPYSDLSWHEFVVEYSIEERSVPRPYPGLEVFLKTRVNRDRHFGSGHRP